MSRRPLLLPSAVLSLTCALAAQQAPEVVSLRPAHLSEVDAKTTTELVVEFDQPMSDSGFSFCGGGATFPKVTNPKPFELGNGVTAVVPTWQAMRPDGVCFEGEDLAPDVFVPCTGDDFAMRDPILEKALELLREQLAR